MDTVKHEENPRERFGGRRSSRACNLCRRRKVRCILIGKYPQCINCLKDGQECTLLESCRQKKIETCCIKSKLPKFIADKNFEEAPQVVAARSNCLCKKSLPSCDAGNCHATKPAQKSSDPPPSDFAFLIQNAGELWKVGAFTLPSKGICSRLVENFGTWHQAFQPLLSKSEILLLMSQPSPSMLLLYAVLFVGFSTVDTSCVHDGGFKSRAHARNVMLQKARNLISCEYETDERRLIQSLYLLTFCEDLPNGIEQRSNFLETIIDHPLICQRNKANYHEPDSIMRLRWLCWARAKEVTMHKVEASSGRRCIAPMPMLRMDALNDVYYGPCCFNDYDQKSGELARLWLQRIQMLLCANAENDLEVHKISRDNPVSQHFDSPSSFEENHNGDINDSLREYRSSLRALAALRNTLPPGSQYSLRSKNVCQSKLPDLAVYQALLHLLYNTQMLAMVTCVEGPLKFFHEALVTGGYAMRVRGTVHETFGILEQLCIAGWLTNLPSSILMPLFPIIAAAVLQTKHEMDTGELESFNDCFHWIRKTPSLGTTSDLHRHLLESWLTARTTSVPKNDTNWDGLLSRHESPHGSVRSSASTSLHTGPSFITDPCYYGNEYIDPKKSLFHFDGPAMVDNRANFQACTMSHDNMYREVAKYLNVVEWNEEI